MYKITVLISLLLDLRHLLHRSLCINLSELKLLDITNGFVMESFLSGQFFGWYSKKYKKKTKKTYVSNLNSLFKWHHFLPKINHNISMIKSSTQNDFLKLFEANQPAKFGEFMTFGLKVRKESVFCARLIRVSKAI